MSGIRLQAKPRHVAEERLLAQAEIRGLDMAGDEADPAETLAAQPCQHLVDRVLVVHVDEIGVDHVEDGVDEHGRQAEALDHPDVGFRQFGAERDNATYRRGGEQFRDRADRLTLEGHDLERIATSRRFGRHTVDVVGDEHAVVAVHGMPVLCDLQEPDGLAGFKARSRDSGDVVQLGCRLEDPSASDAGNLPFAVQHQRHGGG